MRGSLSWLLPLPSHPSKPLHLSLSPQEELGPHICPYLSPGHVQVAQVPGRGDPGSPGELNFPYLFQLLEDEGYKGFVGCEYQPQGESGLRLQAQPWGGENRRDRYWTTAVFLMG